MHEYVYSMLWYGIPAYAQLILIIYTYLRCYQQEVSGVDQAGEEDKAEQLLAHPLLQPVEAHVDRLGLLRANRRSRKNDR